MADIFDQIAAEQVPSGDIFDQLAAEKPDGFHPIGALFHGMQVPAAVAHQTLRMIPEMWNKAPTPELQQQNAAKIQNAVQRPESVSYDLTDMINKEVPIDPNLPAPVKELGTWANAALGTAAGFATDPLSWVGMPGAGLVGKNLAQGLVRAAEREIPVLGKAAQFVGNQLRSFNPAFARKVSPATLAGRDAAIAQVAQHVPASIAEIPARAEQPMWNPWDELKQRAPVEQALQSPLYNPWPEIGQPQQASSLEEWMSRPGAPVAAPDAQGQFDFIPGDLRGKLSRGPRIPKQSVAPIDNFAPMQGDQLEFDFTKGPEPAKPSQLKPGVLERLQQIDSGNPAQPQFPDKIKIQKFHNVAQEIFDLGAEQGMDKPGPFIQSLAAADKALYEGKGPEAQRALMDAWGLLPEDDKVLAPNIASELGWLPEQKKSLDVPTFTTDAEKQAVDSAVRENKRRLQLLKELQKASKLDLGQMFKDLGDVTSAGLSTKSPEQIAAAKAALERLKGEHADALAAHMREPGATVASYVAKHFGQLDPQQQKQMAAALKRIRPTSGNLFTDVMSPELKSLADKYTPVTKRPVITDQEVQDVMANTNVHDKMMELSSEDPKLYAAAVRHAENMAEQSMRIANGDPTVADKFRTEALDYLYRLSKLRHIAGLSLRHAGQKVANKDFLAMLERDLKDGKFVGPDAQLVEETIARGRRLQPHILKSINNGIQEFGINMMLYNTDTAMRNVIGQTIGTVLNPMERAVNAGTTALARAVKIPEHKLKNVTEFGEVLPSLKAGIKAVPGAVRSGIKMFVHETPENIAKDYARKAKAVHQQMLAGTITRAQAKAKIAALQAKKVKLQEDFKLQEDMSSLGFQTDRALSSKNVVLDKAGKTVNAVTRTLKATDLANSQIIKAMEDAALHARKLIQQKRAGGTGSIKLTPADKQQVIDNVLHYSIRQHIPKQISGLYKWINSNFVTGLALPFMRAQVALPRFALNRSPGALPSIALNVGKTIGGTDKLDLMQISRAALGTTMGAVAWASMKNSGVEIHGAAKDPAEQTRRKALQLPMGLYLKFKDGSTKRVDDIAPVSYAFAAAAAFDDMLRRQQEGQPIEDSQWQAGAEAMQNLASGSVFTGTADIAKAVTQGIEEMKDGGRKVYPGVNEGEHLDRGAGKAWLDRKIVSVTVPRLTSEMQRKGWLQEKDNVYRSPRGLGEEYKNALGFGLQKQVPEQIGAFGTPLERPDTMGPMEEVFGLGRAPASDPALQLFDRLQWYPTPPGKTLNGLRVSQEKRMEQLKTFGPAIHSLAQKLSTNQSFNRLPERQQREFLKSTVSEIFNTGNVITEAKMIQQIQRMKPDQKRALQYNLKDKDSDVLAGWGLSPN